MALKDTREGRNLLRLIAEGPEAVERLRAEMANDHLCSCGAVITLISGRWIDADGTAMHGEPGNWAAHRPLDGPER